MRGLLDLLFPPRCVGCRQLLEAPGPFCRRCRDTLVELPAQCCPRCGQPERCGLCEHCRESPPAFESATSALLFGGALADAIHRLKYEDCPQLAEPLAGLMLGAGAPLLEGCSVVAPVSLHLGRLRSRGYDQALLLARPLARLSGRRLEPRAVRRIRATAPQVERDRGARARNVDGAFEARRDLVQGERILLIDDVMTTGATAHAAALALREAGAESVRLLTLARAE